MIKLKNNTDRTIDITNKIKIKPNTTISGDITITSRLQQLINMKLLSIVNLDDSKNVSNSINNSNITPGSMRRKQILKNINKNTVKPSIPLSH